MAAIIDQLLNQASINTNGNEGLESDVYRIFLFYKIITPTGLTYDLLVIRPAGLALYAISKNSAEFLSNPTGSHRFHHKKSRARRLFYGDSYGIRTRIPAVKGRYPNR